MPKSRYLIILMMLLARVTPAQTWQTDTLFREGDLVYYSAMERQSIHNFLQGNPDYLAMIASINPGTDERELGLYRQWIDDIIAEIGPEKIRRLSPGKIIERIKKNVDDALLITFRYEAGFDDLFTSGTYNYNTACAIYAFILDRMEIPYEIYEFPTHFSLVTFPRTERILLEPVPPGQPYFMLSHETRADFVDFLREQGIIDNMTYRNTSQRDLFQQYYFSSVGLTIRELVGMMYVNSAIEFLVGEHTGDSYTQLEKAFLIYPCYKTRFMLLVQLNAYLSDLDYSNPVDLGYLIKASHLIGHGVSFEMVDNYLLDIVSTVLVKQEDRDRFKFIYDYLMEYMSNQALRDNFRFYYLYESGRLEFNETRYNKALEYLEPACSLRPEDDRTQKLLLRSLAGYSLMVSSSHALEKITYYDTAYTCIATKGVYLMVKAQTYLNLFGEAFQLRDSENGSKYIAEFEQLMEDNPEVGIDQIQIGRSYSSAAIFYYREGQVRKSRTMLEKGLSFAPDNIELKLKLESFE